MDAIELLTHDHDEVRGMFKRFKNAAGQGDTAAMGELCEQIMSELQVHTAIEEEILYPQVEQGISQAKELVDESEEEHHVVDQIMAELEGMSPGDEHFQAKMTVLIENVEHHAKEEEEELFPMVREHFGPQRLAAMGEELAAAKQRHESGGGSASGDGASRDELYERAKEQDVPGRSSMTKEELAEAVRDE